MFKARLIVLPVRFGKQIDGSLTPTRRPAKIVFQIGTKKSVRSCRHVGIDEFIRAFARVTGEVIAVRRCSLVAVEGGKIGCDIFLSTGNRRFNITLKGTWSEHYAHFVSTLASFLKVRDSK